MVIRPRAAWRCRVTSSRPRRCWLRSLRRGRDPTPAQALLCHVLDQRGRADSGHTAAVGSQEHRNCSPVNSYPLCCATVLLSATLARTVFSPVRGQRPHGCSLFLSCSSLLSECLCDVRAGVIKCSPGPSATLGRLRAGLRVQIVARVYHTVAAHTIRLCFAWGAHS